MEKLPESYSIQGKRNLFYQYVSTATGTIAVLASAMHFGWPSPSLPQLLSKDSPIRLTSSDGSWVAVITCIGSPLGALIGAFMVDKIGRKSTIMMVSPFYFASWIAIAYTHSLYVIYVARFVAGAMDGVLFIVFPMYVGEISDPRIRGFLGSSMSAAYIFGFLLINLLGLNYSIKTTALIASIVPVAHFITFIWMPESPYYHMMKQKDDKAAKSLKKLTGAMNVDRQIYELKANNHVSAKNSATHLELFTEKGNRKALAILLGLRFIQQFSGNYTIAFYCLMIFNEAGGSISGPTATLIYFTVQLVGSVSSSVLVDKIGRRPLLIISSIGAGFSLGVMGVYLYLKQETKVDLSNLGFIPLSALLFYVILFGGGLSTVPIIMMGELFPTNVKALAMCLVDIFYSGVIVAASKFFQIVNDSFGMYVPFFTFSLCCAIGFIFIVICVPETKGKTLEQIQEELRRGPSNVNVLTDVELRDVNETLLKNNAQRKE